MAEKSTRRVVTELDPMFFIPEGVDELVYTEQDGEDAADEAVSNDTGLFSDDTDETDYSSDPDSPDIYDIVEQKIRTVKGGAQVVDVVFNVEDIPSSVKYEVRVTKL